MRNLFSSFLRFSLISQQPNRWVVNEMRPARRVGMKMRSFQLSVDEDGGSPSRIFGSPEAIFYFLFVAVGLGLSFGDEMNILALGSES